jgi:hypothetical protein
MAGGVTTHAGEPPSSDIAKAAAYVLNQWDALARFVQEGQLSPDNNGAYAARGIVRLLSISRRPSRLY